MKNQKISHYLVLLFAMLFMSSSYAQNNNDGHSYFDDVTYFKKYNYKPNKYLIESRYEYINVALEITKDVPPTMKKYALSINGYATT